MSRTQDVVSPIDGQIVQVPTNRGRGALVVREPVKVGASKNGLAEAPERGTPSTWPETMITIVCTAFAFAVGLKVHPTVASLLAIGVFGLVFRQLWRSKKASRSFRQDDDALLDDERHHRADEQTAVNPGARARNR
jgi:hypothetical protein